MAFARGKQAYIWYSNADSGQVDAQYRLGLAFTNGRDGVPVDYVVAHKWLNLAALGGDDNAIRARRKVAASMSAAEIDAAQQMTREWMSAH
jgi:TPR repeat protein